MADYIDRLDDFEPGANPLLMAGIELKGLRERVKVLEAQLEAATKGRDWALRRLAENAEVIAHANMIRALNIAELAEGARPKAPPRPEIMYVWCENCEPPPPGHFEGQQMLDGWFHVWPTGGRSDD